MLGPLKLRPILKEKVWGGDRLGTVLGKDVSPGDRVGESWELSDRPGDTNVIAEGPRAEAKLSDLLGEHRDDVYGDGPGPLRNGRFPLLIKFIDAAGKLSVQVHPDDAQAEARGLDDVGKTECWYVLDPSADGLVLGLKPGCTRESLAEAVRVERIEACLNYETPVAGELVFCPAGTVHAITQQMMMVEIQQNSDITYRLHDWGRAGLDGKPRELHVEQALSCVKLTPLAGLRPSPVRVANDRFGEERLLDCAQFTVGRWEVLRHAHVEKTARAFDILICIDGRGALAAGQDVRLAMRAGDTVLLPACVRSYDLEPGPRMKLLHVAPKR